MSVNEKTNRPATMNDPELSLIIKEKMDKYVPSRPVQVMHCGVIVFASIIIGVLNLSHDTNAGTAQSGHGPDAWLGVYLAITGLALYIFWSSLRAKKARKEANAEFLAASLKKPKGK